MNDVGVGLSDFRPFPSTVIRYFVLCFVASNVADDEMT